MTDNKDAGRVIAKAEFITSAAHPRGFPDTGLQEIAFAGRSNVGKSSMINRLLGRKKLVKVGQTPGKTRLINFFNVDDAFVAVDLPGYGYAKVSKTERASWGRMIQSYFTKRPQLKACIVILDVRRLPNEDDMQMLQSMVDAGVPPYVILTKADKLSSNKLMKAKADIAKVLGMKADDMILFSAITGRGREDVWEAIDAALG